MAINMWLVHVPTGRFMEGGFYAPISPQVGLDSAGNPIYDLDYSIVILPTDRMPDIRTQMWDGSRVADKTAQEIITYDANLKTKKFTETSRQKDVLATCALVVRARGIATWNGMTPAQKKATVLAEADVWLGIRQFIEDNI